MTNAELRRCGRCGLDRPVDDFAWRRRDRGQRDNYCRSCRAAYKREHYAANRARYIAQALARKQALAAERTVYLLGYFSKHPLHGLRRDGPTGARVRSPRREVLRRIPRP
ncbi:MAG TPA: hypothetical protein VH061_06965 [Solirubrobacteraceae bacterium]|nr:hypothetical protein [Solirubrobacteraceae bacterium]